MYGVDIKVDVSVKELLETLKTNRDKHEKDLKIARDGFRVEIIKELEKKLAGAKEGRKVELSFKNSKPESYLKEYDQVIAMLEFAKQETIELKADDFNKYIKDEWSWKRNWDLSNTLYMSAVK